jgi:hypothetical protein
MNLLLAKANGFFPGNLRIVRYRKISSPELLDTQSS